MTHTARTLLVIDDDDIVRETIATYLEDSDYRVIEACDGEQGKQCFEREHPDVVLCDLRMPKMDGMALLQELTREAPDTPVIVVSGAGVMADVVEALRLGAADYFIKPIVDLEVLEHAVQRCVERLDLLRENRQYREELEQANRELKENLRMLQQDQQAGRHVQMKMMPPQRSILADGYLVEQRVIPSLYLSGDFVDYAEVGDRFVSFYLADVSGHGASSAFVTVLLKNLTARMAGIYAAQPQQYLSPADVLSWANREILESGLDKHVTMFVGVIDVDKQVLHYSVAGHLPMPILANGDKAYFLEGQALPVGLFESAEYVDYTVELEPSFSLVMFSDGVLEILPHERLADKESYLVDMVSRGIHTVSQVALELGLDSIQDAPDDIAVMTVSKGV